MLVFEQSLLCFEANTFSHVLEQKGGALCRGKRCYPHVRLHGGVTHLESK